MKYNPPPFDLAKLLIKFEFIIIISFNSSIFIAPPTLSSSSLLLLLLLLFKTWLFSKLQDKTIKLFDFEIEIPPPCNNAKLFINFDSE